jgi:hypothetical protein
LVAACGVYDADIEDVQYAMMTPSKRASVGIARNEHTGETDAEDLRYVMHRLGRALPARAYYVEANPVLGHGVTQWHFDAQGAWVLEYCPSGTRANRAMFRLALQNAADFRPPIVLQPSTYPDDAQ